MSGLNNTLLSVYMANSLVPVPITGGCPYPRGTDEPVQVQLLDLAGRLALEATGIPGDGMLDLNMAAVKTGLYICRVSTTGRRFAPVKLSIIR